MSKPHIAPCTASFRTVAEALKHAAVCPVCRTTVLAAQVSAAGPAPQTASLRESAGTAAAGRAKLYVQHVADGGGDLQVRRLLSAIAHLERALYYETAGAAGKEHSHITSVLERQRNASS